jgi:hypothetical protein
LRVIFVGRLVAWYQDKSHDRSRSFLSKNSDQAYACSDESLNDKKIQTSLRSLPKTKSQPSKAFVI